MSATGLRRWIRSLPDRRAERAACRRASGAYTGSFAPPLFILGLPRSGTTLVYQYIVHRLHVAYFTNGVGAHPFAPSATTMKQLRENDPYRSDFESSYGRSSGEMAPREAGSFWLRFFDIDAYETRADIDDAAAAELERTIRCVQALFDGAPFVNKNVKHLLHVDALAAIFPDAHFLVVERNREDVAVSVLRGRVNTLGSADAWFSARPENYDELVKLDPVGQIVGQLDALDGRIESDVSRLDASRVHRVVYEAFCDDPDSVIRACAPVFDGVAEKNPAHPRFDIRRRPAANEMEARLLEAVARGGAR